MTKRFIAIQPPSRKPRSIAERLADFSVDENGCHLWRGSVNPRDGYGQTRLYGKRMTASRAAVIYAGIEIPPDHEVDHLCKNRLCINLDHLEVVTKSENLRRSNGVAAKNRDKTHCARGHAFSPENTQVYAEGPKTGFRICLPCKKEDDAKYYKSKMRRKNA